MVMLHAFIEIFYCCLFAKTIPTFIGSDLYAIFSLFLDFIFSIVTVVLLLLLLFATSFTICLNGATKHGNALECISAQLMP